MSLFALALLNNKRSAWDRAERIETGKSGATGNDRLTQ